VLRQKIIRRQVMSIQNQKTSGLSSSSQTLLELQDQQLEMSFAENLFELFRTMSQLPNAKLQESSSLCRHVAAPFNPMFKGVWQPRLEPEHVDAALLESIAWFQDHKAPFFFWWLDPNAQPANLPERLEAHGFMPWEKHAPGMAASLEALDYSAMSKTPAGFEMKRVHDEHDLLEFKEAFVNGLEVPDWAGQAWVDATLSFGIEHAPWRCYVGTLHGKAVASNMLFCGAGVASVFGVATHPEARGQGIGAAISLIAYDEARALGYRYGVLFATDLGQPVYQRIGFQNIGTSISRYLWQAP
jgi:GNAT superfamily N-acetyltransferase